MAPDPLSGPQDPAVLAIVGPTASGKTAIAVEVARAGWRGRTVEVVAADAFTVYRGMDVGTAKPSLTDVPHHMVDVLDPWQDASVAWFQRAARRAIADVHARGAVPLVVGGSGLYFRAIVDPLEFPPTDPATRAAVAARFEGRPEEAHRALTAVDPDAAAKIDPLNLRRTVRALEVIELTGRPFSSFATAWDEHRSVYRRLEVHGVDLPDAQLRARIAVRVAAMVEEGLLAEAAALRAAPHPPSHTALQAIGYREAFAVLDGELAADELVTAVATRTWRYARRQRSWFRRDPRVRWGAPADVLHRLRPHRPT